ncbi:MAG: F0F1 ATP synthase subunit B [Chloroflexi bacterium]|nr:F0F1 ATP synthase subunit B [Chloroflexota bacterium]
MDALGINFGFLIAQIINFGVIFLLLRGVVWGPLLKTIDKRREDIEKGLEDARIASEARANAEKEAESIKTAARAEAQKIVAESRGRGEEAGKDVLAQANTDAEAIRAEARVKAEEERSQLLSDMRGQVISLAIAAANRLIGESMDEKKQQQIVTEFFSKSPENVKGLGSNIEVVSALPLNDNEKKDILSKTGAANADWKVDPAILGGIIIRAGDKVVDGSVRSNLSALSARLN